MEEQVGPGGQAVCEAADDSQYERFLPLFGEPGGPRPGVLRAIDLFAGIGGIRLGFEQAFGRRLQTVLSCEWDAAAQKTYQANFQDDRPIAGDITKLDADEVPPFDICLAGFPCQAFSLAGRRMGFGDDYKGMSRGTLFLRWRASANAIVPRSSSVRT